MTPAEFRAAFPEFSSVVDYPDTQVQFWLDFAGLMLNADRWADILFQGTCLFVAHHLATGNRDQSAALAGGTPGSASGPLASKSVDKVSASYDTGAITFDNGGFWNSTMYGIRLLTLARYVGAGGVQL